MKITVSACYISAVVALSVCLPVSAREPSALGVERIRVDQLSVSLRVPAGWHVEMLNARGARIVPGPEAGGELALLSGVVGRKIELWPIELIAWTSPAPSHSPQQAVA